MQENKFFPELKGKFGFGFMRLPMKDEEINLETSSRMVDRFIVTGLNYFDTAHGYHSGKSEAAIRTCLTSRYPRNSYVLTDKLTGNFFKSEEEIRPFFESQLEACGVEYFDFYLMHSMTVDNYKHFTKCRAFETALELKAEGKIRHLGISFHDRAACLEQILKDWPEIELVQIQFNYVDYEDPSVESRKCLEVCEKYGKPVVVMEPIKGGSLAVLPEEAVAVLDALGSGMSYASYAIRYAAGFDQVMMVLSGMSNMEQLEDNLSYMVDFQALDAKEREAIAKVCEIYNSLGAIPCTGCSYCVDGCPAGIAIPDIFAVMNRKKIFNSWNQDWYYNEVCTADGGKASDCLKCGLCEQICPQHLEIRRLLEEVAEEFDKKN